MDELPHSNLSETQWWREVLSVDPNNQRIEQSFLARLLHQIRLESDKDIVTGKANSIECEFELAQARIQNPIFGVLSRALDAALPPKINLGRFQDKD